MLHRRSLFAAAVAQNARAARPAGRHRRRPCRLRAAVPLPPAVSRPHGPAAQRPGVAAVGREKVAGAALAAQPEEVARRHADPAPAPRALRFVARPVAGSRDAAPDHAAGLSTPQRAMMALVALAELTDRAPDHRREVNALPHRRSGAFARAPGFEPERDPPDDHGHGPVDLDVRMRTHLGEDVAASLRAHARPPGIVFRLAEEHGTVLLPGGGFQGPGRSARMPFANRPCEARGRIGAALRAVISRHEAGRRGAGAGGERPAGALSGAGSPPASG